MSSSSALRSPVSDTRGRRQDTEDRTAGTGHRAYMTGREGERTLNGVADVTRSSHGHEGGDATGNTNGYP